MTRDFPVPLSFKCGIYNAAAITSVKLCICKPADYLLNLELSQYLQSQCCLAYKINNNLTALLFHYLAVNISRPYAKIWLDLLRLNNFHSNLMDLFKQKLPVYH